MSHTSRDSHPADTSFPQSEIVTKQLWGRCSTFHRLSPSATPTQTRRRVPLRIVCGSCNQAQIAARIKKNNPKESTKETFEMASLGTNIDSVTDCVLVEGDVASIQYIRHFRLAPALLEFARPQTPCPVIESMRKGGVEFCTRATMDRLSS